ncbi:MAG: hypothetical protein GX971_15120 [Firmicutes bacterium]|nr:hypothetical protein [Bacillota bacterium]
MCLDNERSMQQDNLHEAARALTKEDVYTTAEIEEFITTALASEILDTRAKKQIENLLQG